MMSLSADLYVDRIDLARHVGEKTCEVCRVDSLEELLERLRSGRICEGKCVHWPRRRVEAFRAAMNAGEVLPQIPSLSTPRPSDIGLFDLGGATADSPLLVTGNSRLTHEVLLAVLSTDAEPKWLLSVDTEGHTVDMSLVYDTLTVEVIAAAVSTADFGVPAFTGRIVLPGLAESLAGPVSEKLSRKVDVGPICAAELPLFFASEWDV